MPFVDFFSNLLAHICQVEESILIYSQKPAIPKNTYRMADAGFGIAHVPGEVNGAYCTMLLLEH